jgi:hypothetical protein
MSDSREAPRRPARAPLRQRSRRRWAIAGGVALCWALAELATRSVITATVLLVVVAGLGVASVAGLRAMGITRDHPWVRRMASRPWRDGWDVLNAAVRHLSDVFVITPSGSLLAPNVVEIQLNPDDLMSVRERMELDVIGASVSEVYEEQVAARGARFAAQDRADVYVVPDDSVPPGRYRLRQGVPVTAGAAPGQYAPPDLEYPSDAQYTRVDYPSAGGSGRHDEQPGGPVTVMEQTRPAIPVLRLVTGSSVAQTVMSGARAGRGPVELVLPDVPTVSREHARFTFSAGRWWIANLGRNGLCLNGAAVTGERPLSDGDSIRWGSRRDAPASRVEIG